MAEPASRKRHTLASLDERVTALENIADDLSKIKGLIKVWAPIGVTAMVTSGLADGKFGAFLHALLDVGG